MAETTAKKLNINLPEATEYSLCPLWFLGKGEENPFKDSKGNPLARGLIKILSEIWTSLKNFGKNAEIRKARLHKKTGLSYGAISFGLDSLKAQNLIEETSPNVYKIIPKVNGKHYIVLDNYLHTQKFNIAGEDKKLTQSAVLVLELVKSFYLRYEIDKETGEKIYINYDFKSRKVKNYFEGSEASIAKQLNLPKSTVADAISELIKPHFLYRNKRLRYKDEHDHVIKKIIHTKGITGNTLSLFAVPYEVLVVEQRSTYKPQEVEFDYDIEEVTVSEAEIESAYAVLRSEAEAKARLAIETVKADEEFCKAREELLQSFSGKAETRYLKRLSELGISQAELSPQYQCSLCDDTGKNIDTGQRCLCRKRIIKMIRESKFKA